MSRGATPRNGVTTTPHLGGAHVDVAVQQVKPHCHLLMPIQHGLGHSNLVTMDVVLLQPGGGDVWINEATTSSAW